MPSHRRHGRKPRGRRRGRGRQQVGSIPRYFQTAEHSLYQVPCVDDYVASSEAADDGSYGRLSIVATLRSGATIRIVEYLNTVREGLAYETAPGVYVGRFMYEIRSAPDVIAVHFDPIRHRRIPSFPFHRHTNGIRGPCIDEDPRCFRDLLTFILPY